MTMITRWEEKEKEKEKEEVNKTTSVVDSKIWYTLAGGLLSIPKPNSTVFYFPQGHAEHSNPPVDFRLLPPCPPSIRCGVSQVSFMADADTDEVFAKMTLVPLTPNHPNHNCIDDYDTVPEKFKSFPKILTQSDANNGGGFSVPRFCAENIFPPLDYTADPPVQTLFARDVHGRVWNFRHIYRGTPRRHLLTTGWSPFVNHKKLICGDTIIFFRSENGDLFIGIKRAKRGNPSRDSTSASSFLGLYSSFPREENNPTTNGNAHPNNVWKGKVGPDSVIQAATLAANGKPFEVVYYPQLGTPEFCIKSSSVMRATQIRWSSGMRVKMPFHNDDSSQVTHYNGVISSIQVADPVRWPHSPWRILEVTWDPPNVFVERVSPWLVELISNMLPFSLSESRTQFLQHSDLPRGGQFSIPSFTSDTLTPSSFSCYASNDTPAGIQGARHAQSSTHFSDHQDIPQTDLLQAGIQQSNLHARLPKTSSTITTENRSSDENVSCLLTMGCSTQDSNKISNKKPRLVLFGQPIFTEDQISLNFYSGPISPVVTGNSSSDGNMEKTVSFSDGARSMRYKDGYINEVDSETGHCKVFMECEDVGRTLDLSVLGSYEDVYRKLADMFGVERSEMLNRVLYRDETGAVKHPGDEPFSKFVRMTKRLTILMDSSSDNIEGSE